MIYRLLFFCLTCADNSSNYGCSEQELALNKECCLILALYAHNFVISVGRRLLHEDLRCPVFSSCYCDAFSHNFSEVVVQFGIWIAVHCCEGHCGAKLLTDNSKKTKLAPVYMNSGMGDSGNFCHLFCTHTFPPIIFFLLSQVDAFEIAYLLGHLREL